MDPFASISAETGLLARPQTLITVMTAIILEEMGALGIASKNPNLLVEMEVSFLPLSLFTPV